MVPIFVVLCLFYALSLVVAILFPIGVYLMSAILAALFVYSEFRAGRSCHVFVQDDPDGDEELSPTEQRLRAINNRLGEMEYEGGHLKVNRDGSYHRGSKLGAHLNEEREALWFEKQHLEQWLFLINFDKWARTTTARNALRWTMLVYVLAGSLMFFTNPSWMRDISNFVGANDAPYLRVAMASLISLVSLPLAFTVHRLRLIISSQRYLKFSASFRN
jgi:hypothetical protein